MGSRANWFNVAIAAKVTYEQFLKETELVMPGAIEKIPWEMLPQKYRAAWIRIFRAGYTMFEEGIVIDFPEEDHD